MSPCRTPGVVVIGEGGKGWSACGLTSGAVGWGTREEGERATHAAGIQNGAPWVADTHKHIYMDMHGGFYLVTLQVGEVDQHYLGHACVW